MVRVGIDLRKRDFVWIGLVVVLLGVGFVVAYGGSSPSVMGHDSGEVMVNVGGVDKPLQVAIDAGDFAGAGVKSWVNFDGDTAPYTNIRDSYNVAYVQYDGSGVWRVYWSTPFPDDNYTPLITTSAGPVRLFDVNSAYVRFQVFSISNSPAAALANWISVSVLDN